MLTASKRMYSPPIPAPATAKRGGTLVVVGRKKPTAKQARGATSVEQPSEAQCVYGKTGKYLERPPKVLEMLCRIDYDLRVN